MKRFICLTVISLVMSTLGAAANQVGLTYIWGDTLWTDEPGYFIVSIAVDSFVTDLSMGFGVSSPDGAGWILDEAGGFETDPPGPRFVRGIPESDWMNGVAPDGSCWDVGGTVVTSDLAPDQFSISGEALSAGLAGTTLQPMLEIHFTPYGAYGDDIKTLCIDSMYYPSSTSGAFLFTPGGPPELLWGNTPLCFPVKTWMPAHCPTWTCDNPINVSVSHADTARVRVQAVYPEGDDVYYHLAGVTGGAGTAIVNLHSGDVTYIPDPADANRTVAIQIEASDIMHTACLDYTCTILVDVTNNAPVIDCGNSHNMGGSGDLFMKFDISASDPDSSDEIQYSVHITPYPCGIYSIDNATGIFSFNTSWEDGGYNYEICVVASDGMDDDSCCFHLDVCTCVLPGEIDGLGDVNIGDAVALIYYIFKIPAGPINMNWADVNADCNVNIADVVYLIDYIFKGGPEPQLGCYY